MRVLRPEDVTRGIRGASDNQYGNTMGGENATWGVNPDTGKEEAAFKGPGGGFYLASDILKKYGRFDMPNPEYGQGVSEAAQSNESPTLFDIGGWGLRPGPDFLSGDEGWRDALKIAGMAAPVAGAAFFGAEAVAGEGLAAGDAGTAGGEGFVAGSGGAEGMTAQDTALIQANAGGGSTSMPAAVPETAESLSEMGLTETSPGVYDATKPPTPETSLKEKVKTAAKTAATVLTPTSAILQAGSAIKAAGRAKSGAPAASATRPAEMPSYTGQKIFAVRRASLTDQMSRRGRASTVLTKGGERLGR